MPIGFFPKTPVEDRIAAGGPGRAYRKKKQAPKPFVRKKPYKAPPPEPQPEIHVKSAPLPPPLPPARREHFVEFDTARAFVEHIEKYIPKLSPEPSGFVFKLRAPFGSAGKVISEPISTGEIVIEIPIEEIPFEPAPTSAFAPSFEEEKQEVAAAAIEEEDDIPFIVALAEDELELAALFASGV